MHMSSTGACFFIKEKKKKELAREVELDFGTICSLELSESSSIMSRASESSKQ